MIPTLPNLPGSNTIALPSVTPAPIITPADVIAGLNGQLVMWQLVFLGLLGVLIFVLIFAYPLIPWLVASFKKRMLIGILDSENTIRFDNHSDIKNGMYYYRGEPYPFVRVLSDQFYLNNVPFTLISLNLKLLQSQWYKNLTKHLTDLGILNWEQAELYYRSTENQELKEKLQQLMECVEYEEIDGYGVEVPANSMSGEVDQLIAEKRNKNLAEMITYLLIGVVIVMVMIGGAIAFVIVTK